MSTSGQTIFELSRDSIIAASLRKIGALASGQSASATQLSQASEALNALISEFQTFGMPLWKRTQYTFSLTINQNSYNIGMSQAIAIPFPLQIDGILIRVDGSAQEILPLDRTQFNLLNTTVTGKPNQYTYQPFINYGVIKLWPKPDDDYSMEITYRQPVEGFTSGSQTPDFPQEWQNALIYGLASLLAPEYGVPLNDRQMLAKEAEKHLDIAKDFNYENVSIFFQVDRD